MIFRGNKKKCGKFVKTYKARIKNINEWWLKIAYWMHVNDVDSNSTGMSLDCKKKMLNRLRKLI